jgi:hypothetical protein
MVGRPDTIGLAVGPRRYLIRRDDTCHALAVRQREDRYDGEERPGQHLPPDRQRQSSRRGEEDYGLSEYTQGCRERRIAQRTARRGVPNVESDAQRKARKR